MAVAIDDAFARWDRSHLHEFTLFEPDATFDTRPQRVADPSGDWDDDNVLAIGTTKLSILRPCQQFLYVFDLGDEWTHLCTDDQCLIDPLETIGITTAEMPGPLPYWGWGSLPDQYGRRYDGDSDEDELPPDPDRGDLPPLRPWWGRVDRQHPS